MKHLIFIFLSCLILTGCANEKKLELLNCRGEIIDVGLSIKGQSPCSHCEISKEVFAKGISLVLSDTAYKISQFTVGYSTPGKLLLQEKVRGNILHSKDTGFLKKLQTGDIISIDCIKIIRDKEPFLSTSILIVVI